MFTEAELNVNRDSHTVIQMVFFRILKWESILPFKSSPHVIQKLGEKGCHILFASVVSLRVFRCIGINLFFKDCMQLNRLLPIPDHRLLFQQKVTRAPQVGRHMLVAISKM